MRKFPDARHDRLQIHDRHLQFWALEKASRLMMSTAHFKASHSWVQILKRKKERHERLPSFRRFDKKNIEDVQVAAVEFQTMMKDDMLQVFRKKVFNADQSGMAYDSIPLVLFSFREKSTNVLTQNLNSLTHSYTILTKLSMSEEFMAKLHIYSQKLTGELGSRIREIMRVPVDTCFCYAIREDGQEENARIRREGGV